MKKTDILILLFSILTFIFTGASLFKIITTYAPDFAVLYKAANDLKQNINPYTDNSLPDVFIYPVTTGIFYYPFTYLSYNVAQGLFVLISAFSVPFIVIFSLKILNEKFSWRHILLFTSLAYLSFPVKFTLGMGQSNLLAVFLLVLGYDFYKNNSYTRGGILIVVAYFLKPILGLTVLFFILTKSGKILNTIFLTTVILVLFSIFLFGQSLFVSYIGKTIPSLLNGVGNPIYYNQSFAGFMARSTTDVQFIKLATGMFGLMIILSTIYVAVRKKIDKNILFAIFVTIIPLIHTLSWQHHFAILIFPFIVAAMWIVKMKKYFLLILLSVSYLLISWNIKEPFAIYTFPFNLLLSHVFYGCLLLLFILFSITKYKKFK